MLYFAYGSNMDWERMTHSSRATHAQFLFKALLPNHTLRFTRRTDAGSGAADIVPTGGTSVWGIVYHIEPEDHLNLDLQQGVRLGDYRPEKVVVHPDGDLSRSLEVFTYVVCRKIPIHQPPTRQYLNYLLNGARQARLPDAYIEALQRFETLG